MAYTINLYNFTKKVNSTKQPSGTGTPINNVLLKSGTSIQNPIFTINGNNFSSMCNFNYLKFEANYYFIDDIKSVNNATVEITASLDVLATYKDDIGNYECVISRCNNASYYNLYDIDNIYQPTNYIIANFEESVNTNFSYNTASGGSVTMSYYGKEGAFAVNTSQVSTLISNLFDNSTFWDTVASTLFQPSNYIANMIKLPFSFDSYGSASIQLGSAPSVSLPVANKFDYSQIIGVEKDFTIDLSTITGNTDFKYRTDYRAFNLTFIFIH